MPVDEQWKARVDKVFAGGDLRGLFKAAGSPFGVGREESIGREKYLVGRLRPYASEFERLARETDPGDLSPEENVNRLMTLSEVSNARVEELHTVAATSSPRLAAEELIRLEAEERRAFGRKTAIDAAMDATRQLQAGEPSAPSGPVDPNREWKARVDEVLAGGDLTKLFRVAGPAPDLGSEDSRYRHGYLGDALSARFGRVEWAAQATDPGDLTELEAIDRTFVLHRVASNLEDDRLHNASPGGIEEAAAHHEEDVRRAFGGRTGHEAIEAAYGRLREIEASSSQAVGGPAAHAAFAGLGQVRPGQTKAASEVSADEAEAGVEVKEDGAKAPTYGKPTGRPGPVVET